MYIWNGAYVLGGMCALLFNITYYFFAIGVAVKHPRFFY